jgi:hypothetical protein
MEPAPETAIQLARAAHRRLIATAERIDESAAPRPTRLPGWTVGHVLT